jgi:hypothetical protein
MNNYVSIHGLCICAAIFIISGCSITSHYGADPPDWDYKCPDFVSQEDNEYCHDHAYDAASNVMRETASDGFSNTAILLGPFGVLGGAAYISEGIGPSNRTKFHQFE